MNSPASTTYHYITHEDGVHGGQPVIVGTRTSVKSIVGYYKMGLSVEDILEGLPHLTPAQIYEALSYYHDHISEIEQNIEDGRVEHLIERYGLSLAPDGRLIVDDSRGT